MKTLGRGRLGDFGVKVQSPTDRFGDHNQEPLYLFEPKLDQTMAVQRRLIKARQEPRICTTEPTSSAALWINAENKTLPSGSKSTRIVVDRLGSFSFRGIRFSKENLRFNDKAYGQQVAEKCGIAVPVTWQEWSSIPMKVKTVFVKPAKEGVKGLRIPVSRSDAKRFLNHGYIAQEYFTGGGVYGFGFIAQDGEVLVGVPHHEVRSWPSNGGSASVIRRFEDRYFQQMCEHLVREARYSGWGLLEFLRPHGSDRFIFLELNAKLWASLEFSFRAEPRLAKLLLGVDEVSSMKEYLVFPSRLIDMPIGEMIYWLTNQSTTILHERTELTRFIRGSISRRLLRRRARWPE